jgi:signal transduction histidine kinase
MDNLIDSILEYSRLDALPAILSLLISTARARECDLLMPPSNIQITFTQKLPVILGDIARIQQIFANLIGNAIKFMDKPWELLPSVVRKLGRIGESVCLITVRDLCQYHEKFSDIPNSSFSR